MKNEQDKQKAKQEKLLKKEAKSKAKFEQKMAKRNAKKQSGKTSVEKNTSDWTSEAEQPIEDDSNKKDGFFSKRAKRKEFKKTLYDRKDLKREKEAKEKKDYKLAFKEFPVKMVKEVNKIKWSGKQNLTKKFLEVIIFMICVAVFFYLIDWAFQAIFTAIHVI